MSYLSEEEDRKMCAQFFRFTPGEAEEAIEDRLKEIRKSGICCVVAGCEGKELSGCAFDDAYFEAARALARACGRQGMRFWLEDYSPFPTGSANGAYKEEENKALGKLFIDERHIDITGPMEEAVIRIDALEKAVYGKAMNLFPKTDPDGRSRIAVIACRMAEDARRPRLVDGTAVVLDSLVQNGYLKWAVPEGNWRVFVVFSTYEGAGRPDYMNLLSRRSVELELHKVHIPIYEHLKDYLGTSWEGFFYDEPEIGNAGNDKVFDFFMLPGRRSGQRADCDAYPWSEEMPEEMAKRDSEWIRHLPCLWYEGVKEHRQFWRDYMDAVTTLVRENYNGQIYAFCAEKGIHYMGHVLEDEGSHTRLGCGAGHYFRQQYYQDEAGIDVIAGQILPGRDHTASWYGVTNADGEFYHYGLAKLASSEAHINPVKKNRAMAECFAMYGQQGLAERKYLIDHLLVNGINRMLLAGISSYMAPGEYSMRLVQYTDAMCSLLRSTRSIIKTAILYHAEAEWGEGDAACPFQKPAAELARHQISYDVVPADVFAFPDRYGTETQQGLSINGNAYEALIIPAQSELAPPVLEFVRNCRDTGFPVFFTERLPENLPPEEAEGDFVHCVGLQELGREVARAIHGDICVKSEQRRWIRYSHLADGETHYYLIHNEAPGSTAECEIALMPDNGKESVAGQGEVVLWDIIGGMELRPETETSDDGAIRLKLTLGKYEMVLLRIAEADGKAVRVGHAKAHKGCWELTFAEGEKASVPDGSLPRPEDSKGYGYYGKLVYDTTFTNDGEAPYLLSLGNVSDCCEVFVNGHSCGKRMGAPYLYEVESRISPGENQIRIEVYTSAANIKNPMKFGGVGLDCLTAIPYSLVEKEGIQGPVSWLYRHEQGMKRTGGER